MDHWNNKVAVVTGVSAGIGKAVAIHLVTSGLKVIGLARRTDKLDALAKELEGKSGQFFPLRSDITNEQSIINAFEWTTKNVGVVHILVNNAGISRPITLIDGPTSQWREIVDTNLLGLCIATREAIKIMRANNVNGHVIHINSVIGHRVPNLPNLNVYPATKFGVTALTETLRQELNSIGSKIKITSISPGFVDTEMAEASGCSNELLKCYAALPKLLSDDIAQAVLYVLSTPPHVQVHELIIKPVGKQFFSLVVNVKNRCFHL